jgi:hypothetical protein
MILCVCSMLQHVRIHVAVHACAMATNLTTFSWLPKHAARPRFDPRKSPTKPLPYSRAHKLNFKKNNPQLFKLTCQSTIRRYVVCAVPGVHIYIYTYVYIYIYIYIYIYTHTNTNTQTCIHVYIHTQKHALMIMCICICMCVRTYVDTKTKALVYGHGRRHRTK